MTTSPRLVVVGAGGMGRAWMRTILDADGATLAGVVDLRPDVALAALEDLGASDVPAGDDVVTLAREVGADAVVDVAIPEAHHAVTTAALFAGYPVLGEKPAAVDVAQALSLAAASEVTGRLFMVSQSRRWNPHVESLRAAVGTLGAVGSATAEFFRAPRFGGFREAMAQPLLVDMAIHHLDAARYVLGAEAESVWCDTYNPSWSWYDGDAAAVAVFEMAGGARFSYHGSWCAPGAETSWNASWRIGGALGTVTWDGETAPVVDDGDDGGPHAVTSAAPSEGIAAALAAFLAALAGGTTPSGEIHENVRSLAMVEAAVESARTGERVRLDDLLERARVDAVAAEANPEVRAVLAGWSSVREALVAR
ncbi:oxidoreductase domain protein [Beutenbergia cavernae DSM 12333]|uniref:Oxidoreductase domain protein n=1 Tax=Beutenbergia cavernae (strain ATCC BAA-8 / DSM 12333 / CCUG 43141 / JCM 11478 / NBRC 16432 / NCIMB 13614 / HKI 0122) TaxID=471853 RepID=C5C102_BEUC1|nr:Gfo/Idh/MocA family oxidoreductase [Beutenbergia cavernae]ACQ79406.1 oxidoreductase domain protein [Beutenbergia cavernae DSM 12333]